MRIKVYPDGSVGVAGSLNRADIEAAGGKPKAAKKAPAKARPKPEPKPESKPEPEPEPEPELGFDLSPPPEDAASA